MKLKNSIWVVEACTSTAVANWNPVLSYPEVRGVFMTRKQARGAIVRIKKEESLLFPPNKTDDFIYKYRVNRYSSLV